MSKDKNGGRTRAGESTTVGAEIDVVIERVLPGGLGLAHADGQTLLVALAAPGDRLRVRVENKRGRTLFASIVEILEPSPQRVKPPCPYFGRCGGCDFQQLNYEAQLAAKAEIIRDCLRRIARLEPPADLLVTPAPSAWRYRSRARWQFEKEAEKFGYFARGSHEICDVVECPVIVPELQTTLTTLREKLRVRSLPDDADEIEAVVGDNGAIALSSSLTNANIHEATRTVGGERYRFSANCFFQINHDLLEPLVAEALRFASGDTALDLYCGVGLFTLPLARRFKKVIGVEANKSATRYAIQNLREANLINGMIETSAVGDWLKTHARALKKIDFVLLDPPRAGAEPEAVEGIKELRPARISYVSCDPATLARDLRSFTEAGYELESIRAFDLFPQTHHVETVAHLIQSS